MPHHKFLRKLMPSKLSRTRSPVEKMDTSAAGGEADSEWINISYYELDKALGAFCGKTASNEKIYVNCSVGPDQRDRFGLGKIAGENRNSTVIQVRENLGKGISVYRTPFGSVYLTCLCDLGVFVESLELNSRLGSPRVKKLKKDETVEIFNLENYMEILRKAATLSEENENPFVSVSKVVEMANVRVSFIKGYGGGQYNRKEITSVPCWIELQLCQPLKETDHYLQQLVHPLFSVVSSRS